MKGTPGAASAARTGRGLPSAVQWSDWTTWYGPARHRRRPTAEPLLVLTRWSRHRAATDPLFPRTHASSCLDRIRLGRHQPSTRMSSSGSWRRCGPPLASLTAPSRPSMVAGTQRDGYLVQVFAWQECLVFWLQASVFGARYRRWRSVGCCCPTGARLDSAPIPRLCTSSNEWNGACPVAICRARRRRHSPGKRRHTGRHPPACKPCLRPCEYIE